MVGKTLGHYEILEPLGAGGMGEVYRARDTKLDRDVAIKVLPEDFANDADRLARFEREAKLLASLNHANIAAIYGLEDEGDQRFIAMELVEGETLAERLAQSGRIEVDEALDIARQIAEALEAAHENGVIHRDLKPANVVVTPDGKAKVLDFGLAKAYEADGSSSDVSPDLSHSPTMAAATRTGVILGTAAYMSPEQARGKPVDKRADIWAFGCVLYEILTGSRAFDGDTVSDTMAAILKEEPDWDALPTELGGVAVAVIRRCLEKDPRARLRDAGDVGLLAETAFDSPGRTRPAESPEPLRIWQRPVPATVAAIGLVALASAVSWAISRLPTPTAVEPGTGPITRFTVSIPGGELFGYGGEIPNLTLSPDGETFAYVYDDRLYVRQMDDPEPVALEATEGASGPFFSPDSQWVGFFQRGGLKRIRRTGGGALDVPGAFVNNYGIGAWGAPDTIVFRGPAARIPSLIPVAGGTPTPVTELQADEREHIWPQLLDGDAKLLYTAIGPSLLWRDSKIVVEDLESGHRAVVANDGSYGRYLPTGHVVYATEDGRVLAVPFDLDAMEVTGTPFAVETNVRTAVSTGGAAMAFSDAGTAAFGHGPREGRTDFWWLDRKGIKLEQLAADVPIGYYFDLSTDGQVLATDMIRDGNYDIYSIDTSTGVENRLTTNISFEMSPAWSPDGRLAYVSYGPTGQETQELRIFVQDRPGAEAQPIYTAAPNESLWVYSWSRDGWLVFVESTDGQQDVYAININDREKKIIAAESGEEWFPQFSPDGRFVAYREKEGGANHIVVKPLSNLNEKVQFSPGEGDVPRWSADGRELYYWAPNNTLMAVEVLYDDESIRPGSSEALFIEPDLQDTLKFDVAEDGRFLVGLVNESGRATEVTVTLNWFEHLRSLDPNR